MSFKSSAPIRLASVVDIKTGFPFRSNYYAKNGRGYRLLRGDNVVQGKLRWDNAQYWPEKLAAGLEDFSLDEGDVVLAMDRPWIEAGLKYARITKDDLPAFLVQRVARLRAKSSLSQRFLFYLIGSKEFTQHILAVQTGTAVPHISSGQIGDFEFPLPPIAEQQKIADSLSMLDDKIDVNRKINVTLEQIADTLFKSWFVDFDPVKAKASGQQPESMDAETAALFPDEFEESELGMIPKGWKVRTIDDVTSLIIDHRGKTPKKLGSDWALTGIPAISAKNIKAGRMIQRESMNYVDEELYATWMKEKLADGDILMTSEAPLGELLYLTRNTRLCLSQRVFALRANQSNCGPAYLFFWLKSPATQGRLSARATGTTVVGIRQSELRKIEVLLPHEKIQQKANSILHECLSGIEENEEQNETLSNIRNVLLPKLISGQLPLPSA